MKAVLVLATLVLAIAIVPSVNASDAVSASVMCHLSPVYGGPAASEVSTAYALACWTLSPQATAGPSSDVQPASVCALGLSFAGPVAGALPAATVCAAFEPQQSSAPVLPDASAGCGVASPALAPTVRDVASLALPTVCALV